MVRPKRNAQQTDIQEAIKNAAWKQITEFGAPALSLRAIARELGFTAPAIYNYFPRRDDLVTALIIDAYLSFGDSQLAARDAVPAEDIEGQMTAIGLAYREWALTHPQRYQLIFGTPIPGYEGPEDRIMPAGVRSMSALVSVVEAFRRAGRLSAEGFPQVPPAYEKQLEVWKSIGGEAEMQSLAVAFLVWARVHGLVSLEISGHLPPFGAQGDALYRFELDSVARQFFRA